MIRAVIHHGLRLAARVPGARLLVYLAQALRFRAWHGGPLRWSRLAADYGAWRDDRVRRHQPLADGLAWITYGAIEFLDAKLCPAMRGFEYGAGGSTVFMASRVGQLVSVEHDGAWVGQVQGAVTRLGLLNATILHVESAVTPAIFAPDDPDGYVSALCPGRSFRAYAETIDAFPDECFHVILIDGRARPSCFKHAVPKLAPGGIIMLDNAERDRYACIRRTLDGLGWTRLDFAGAGPWNEYFWKTTAWIRPGAWR